MNNKKVPVKESDVAWVRALYDAEVTYQDEQLGTLLRELERQDLLKDTIVVITNDHGEEVFDRAGVGHGWTLYEENIRAPLLISYPPLFESDRVEREIVEHVDIAPTLVDALDVAPMGPAEGAIPFASPTTKTARKTAELCGVIPFAARNTRSGSATTS